MSNLEISPNQTRQFEEHGTFFPLILFPVNYAQIYLLKEINEDFQKLNYP